MIHNFKKQLLVVSTIVAFVLMFSCNKFNKAVVKEQYLDSEVPAYYPGLSEQSNAVFHLGRVLFYDKSLSVNNSISCASCHKQQLAFADDVAFSAGFENRLTKRNSIAIQNLSVDAFGFGETKLFWDGRENSLQSLISKPIANHIEMGMDNSDELLQKLNALPYVQDLLKKAYGENEKLDMERLSNAMAQFLSLISTNQSKFDQDQMGGNNNKLNAVEKKGQLLFQTTYQCNNCHNPAPGPYNSSTGFVNIGLDINNTDKGRMNISGNGADEGAFKVPDLHNVALTAPYMHDGRFETLDEVLEHYSHGIQNSNNLDLRLKNADGSPKKLQITEEDKKSLIAFLNTMTDYSIMANPLLSNPFKYK